MSIRIVHWWMPGVGCIDPGAEEHVHQSLW
jgi:hypothetical protein